jgi:hypothetical protein
MPVRDCLIQETEGLPESMLTKVLDFLQALKGASGPTSAVTMERQALEARVEYLETILGIQNSLASFDRGEGMPAATALDSLREQFQIPPRS